MYHMFGGITLLYAPQYKAYEQIPWTLGIACNYVGIQSFSVVLVQANATILDII